MISQIDYYNFATPTAFCPLPLLVPLFPTTFPVPRYLYPVDVWWVLFTFVLIYHRTTILILPLFYPIVVLPVPYLPTFTPLPHPRLFMPRYHLPA